jgi:F-type H+-transporting ATPase subunit gamma
VSGKLKEVRDRIKSVQNTQQITKAMKMVSAAKLRRAQQAIVEMRPYSERLDIMLKNILSNLGSDAESPFGLTRPVEKVLIVVITSNRGLCGAFNTNIIKSAVAKIDGVYADVRAAGNLSIMCIGKRGFDYFRKRYQDCDLINDHVELMNHLNFEEVSTVSETIMAEFAKGNCDRVFVSYGRFKNAAMQFPECQQYLPVLKIKPLAKKEKSFKADYIFEPGKKELLHVLIPSILNTSFYKCLLDTHASEHGARMTAMDKATDNADELMGELRIFYNKARQEAITKELSEIVGGAASL